MEAQFWHEKWERNEIGFHQADTNRMLLRFLEDFGLEQGARIFLPLCGKTRDIAWLMAQGFRVAGAELSELAVQQMFRDMGRDPAVTDAGPLKHYAAQGIDIFVGDIFDLTGDVLGPVDLVFDRAALIALPGDMRARYAAHLVAITGAARQFLIGLEYDPAELKGPPFSVPPAEVRQIYDRVYDLELLSDEEVPGKLKGVCDAQEQAWRLTPV